MTIGCIAIESSIETFSGRRATGRIIGDTCRIISEDLPTILDDSISEDTGILDDAYLCEEIHTRAAYRSRICGRIREYRSIHSRRTRKIETTSRDEYIYGSLCRTIEEYSDRVSDGVGESIGEIYCACKRYLWEEGSIETEDDRAAIFEKS